MKTFHVCVKGKVQGVWFRESTRQQAEALELTGWVRNLPDGSVEAMISGEDTKVDQMLIWFNTGSPHSRVEQVTSTEVSLENNFNSFRITF